LQRRRIATGQSSATANATPPQPGDARYGTLNATRQRQVDRMTPGYPRPRRADADVARLAFAIDLPSNVHARCMAMIT
jgi:hypothetical protein